MIKRLQWLYPPTANRFFMNLMTILCDRIEAVTNNFACETIVDDLTGWYNRRGFINMLETEIHRSRRYQEHLALCLMGIDLEVSDKRIYRGQKKALRVRARISSQNQVFRRPADKARKRMEYRDISSFRNAARWDGWAPRMLSYFCARPKIQPAQFICRMRYSHQNTFYLEMLYS